MKKFFISFLVNVLGFLLMAGVVICGTTAIMMSINALNKYHDFSKIYPYFTLENFKTTLLDKKTIYICILILAVVLIIQIFYNVKNRMFNAKKGIDKFEKTKSDLYGNARLMEQNELVQHFGVKNKKDVGIGYYTFHKPNSKLNVKHEKAGWVVNSYTENGHINYLMFDKDSNMVTIGSPGVGKTQYFLMPNIIINACNGKEQPTMIINDVKGELFEQTSKRLHDAGYKILNLNLRQERSSSRYNPLQIIWDYYQRYINLVRIRKVNLDGKIESEIEIDLSNDKTQDKILFEKCQIGLKFSDLKSKLKLINRNQNESFGITDLVNNKTDYYQNELEIDNDINDIGVFGLVKSKDENGVAIDVRQKLYNIQILKNGDYIDKVTTEILALSSTIIPEGSGENQSWNTGSRGIIEGCIWGMLEDSCNPKLNMTLEKFTINNIGNIINKMSSTLPKWLKFRDKRTSKALTSSAMIVDNASEKTVGSYISNTQTLLKQYLTSGIAYITSASDFTLDEIINSENPVALYLTIPDENATKYPIATLLIKQIYNYMIYQATKNKGNHLSRKAYFYLDEFAQMPKISEFKQWVNACRSRWIYFDIIIQSVNQLYGTYGKDDGFAILNSCSIHLFLGSSDIETVKYFHDELGKETVITHSASGSTTNYIKMESSQNYSMTGKDIVPMNQLTEMKQGEAYFKIFRFNPCKTNYVPYFDATATRIGLFTKGFVDVRQIEKIYSEKNSFYDIEKVADYLEDLEEHKQDKMREKMNNLESEKMMNSLRLDQERQRKRQQAELRRGSSSRMSATKGSLKVEGEAFNSIPKDTESYAQQDPNYKNTFNNTNDTKPDDFDDTDVLLNMKTDL